MFSVLDDGLLEAPGCWNEARKRESKSPTGLLRASDALWEQLSRGGHIEQRSELWERREELQYWTE